MEPMTPVPPVGYRVGYPPRVVVDLRGRRETRRRRSYQVPAGAAPRAWNARGRNPRPLPPDWPARRRLVLVRDRNVCQIAFDGCTVRATEVDHVIPRSRGGSDQLENLQAACSRCHASKTGREANPPRRRPPEPHPGRIG